MEQGKPLMSVIVPVYNVENYLERCLDSILAQTYGNLEVLLIDDASRDNSGAICDAYAARDSRVRVIHFPENRGPSAARNIGIQEMSAEGALVSFWDADDYAEPDLLEKLYGSMLEAGADISACGTDGLTGKEARAAVYSREEALRWIVWNGFFSYSVWGKLYPAELVKACPFHEGVFCSEDLLFLYQVFQRIDKFSYTPEKLYHHVCRKGSLSHNHDFARKCTALLVIDSICEDAAVRSREVLPDFQQLALEIYRDLAREAVERSMKAGETFRYLKRFQKGVRRHFSWRALALLPRAQGRAAVLALYASTATFWALAHVYARIKRQGGE